MKRGTRTFRRATTALLLTTLAVVSTLVAASPAHAFPRGACDSTLAPEGRPGRYFDGPSPLNRSVWTHNMNATQMLWQQDGNLVLYTAGYARAVWSSRTHNKCTGSRFPYLTTQSDNNLVIYCGAEGTNALWASNTAGI
ncbi:hypothetical protein [Cryptosporangium minutisporangium]|uniref:hypothetical protein n=1 Tax=Cryptosporangium minutisporangium TaxID=113569 RepID=UPI0031F17755